MTEERTPNRWRRYNVWDDRSLANDRFAALDPAYGFAALASPHDPCASLTIVGGRVTVMDGVAEADFDMIDTFIARHHIDPAVAPEAMVIAPEAFARMMVDVAVPRAALVRLARGLTPARLAEIGRLLNVAELTFAQVKLRARRTPGNQAHVTNAKDDPLQMAADAATAALYGFDELETTVRVARNARTSALALTVGARRRAGAVLDREGGGAAPRPGRVDLVHRDHVGLRQRADVHRRRRHAMVQGVPDRRLRDRHGAEAVARLIEEAAEVYERRGLFRRRF